MQTGTESLPNPTGCLLYVQVQQLLLDTTQLAPNNGNGTRGRAAVGVGLPLLPPPEAGSNGRGRLLDAFATSHHYYHGGGYVQHVPPTPTTNVEDLVALWFAGPSTSGLFLFLFLLVLSTIIASLHHLHTHVSCLKKVQMLIVSACRKCFSEKMCDPRLPVNANCVSAFTELIIWYDTF